MNKRTKHNLDGLYLSSSQIETLINEWIHSRRDREIMRLKFLDDLSYEEIADRVHLSLTQTKTIAYKSVDLIKECCFLSL